MNMQIKDTAEWLKVTLLCAAAQNNSVEELKAMLASGDVTISVNNGDYDKRTALMVACASGSFEAVELLLANGADVNSVDRWGSCALWECITHRNDAIADLLLLHGALVALPHSKIVSYLFQLVADSNMYQLENVLRVYGQSSAHTIGNRLATTVRPKQCAYQWFEDYDMRTPLHLAADEKKVDVARVLVLSGLVDPMAPDRWGKTAVDCGLVLKKNEDQNSIHVGIREGGDKAAAKQSDKVVETEKKGSKKSSGSQQRKERRRASGFAGSPSSLLSPSLASSEAAEKKRQQTAAA
jgi:ankyrin repeat protein